MSRKYYWPETQDQRRKIGTDRPTAPAPEAADLQDSAPDRRNDLERPPGFSAPGASTQIRAIEASLWGRRVRPMLGKTLIARIVSSLAHENLIDHSLLERIISDLAIGTPESTEPLTPRRTRRQRASVCAQRSRDVPAEGEKIMSDKHQRPRAGRGDL
jgi:hypothetical protein